MKFALQNVHLPLPVIIQLSLLLTRWVSCAMADVYISPDDVFFLFSTPLIATEAYPDNIHPCLLKSRALRFDLFYVAYFYTILEWCNASNYLEAVPCYYPFVQPRYGPLNEWSVSMASVCCKTMERIVSSHLIYFREGERVLSENQFGFRRHRSTED